VVEDSTAGVQPDRVVVEALLGRATRDEVIRFAIAGIGLARPPQGFTPESTPTQPAGFVWLCLALSWRCCSALSMMEHRDQLAN
jgi:hypothetical protein